MTPEHLQTPSPQWRPLLDLPSPSGGQPVVSVVVSLYNYGHCILDTLSTVAAQSLEAIELVVVDDASTDEGAPIVEAWLRKNSRRFAGVRLLQHVLNGGLAAARNTGFAQAEASWVWVQDADNPLAPRALEQCHRLAERVEAQVAVIHPLLVTMPAGSSPQVFQGEGRPWQKAIFKPANTVDAMALVRRKAWEEVGGYVHIPDGWEDYDFWCSLMDAGWTGVQCPQPLGTYLHHSSSMTAISALPNVRRLEQLLQARHPWLTCVGRTTGHSRE
jgi:glycosyltransferase involved in cell wall biosynthesis